MNSLFPSPYSAITARLAQNKAVPRDGPASAVPPSLVPTQLLHKPEFSNEEAPKNNHNDPEDVAASDDDVQEESNPTGAKKTQDAEAGQAAVTKSKKAPKAKAKEKAKSKAKAKAKSSKVDDIDETMDMEPTENQSDQSKTKNKRKVVIEDKSDVKLMRDGHQYYLKYGRDGASCKQARTNWQNMSREEQCEWHRKCCEFNAKEVENHTKGKVGKK